MLKNERSRANADPKGSELLRTHLGIEYTPSRLESDARHVE